MASEKAPDASRCQPSQAWPLMSAMLGHGGVSQHLVAPDSILPATRWGWCGAEGRIRTGTGCNSQRFLRPPRLPFRHFGTRREGQSPHLAIIGNAPRPRQQRLRPHRRTRVDSSCWHGRGRPTSGPSLGLGTTYRGGRALFIALMVVRRCPRVSDPTRPGAWVCRRRRRAPGTGCLACRRGRIRGPCRRRP